PIVAGADPADIGVLVGTDGAPEGPAALLALDEGGEQVFVALPLLIHLERLAAGLHDLLGSLKDFRVDDPQVWLLHHHPFRSVLVRPLAGQKVGYFLLAVNDFPRIEFIGQDAADTVLAPLAVPLCPQPPLIEEDGD